MKHQTLLLLAAAAVLALAAWWYESPYLVMREMKSAVDARDADAFNQHVDYPRLRDSLKAQLAAALGAPPPATDGDAAGQAGNAFASAFGTLIASGVVDALVRPELVMNAMRLGDLQVPGAPPPAPAPAPAGPAAAPGAGAARDAWVLDREGLDTVVVHRGAATPPATAFVFERHGLGDWKLAGVRLAARR